MKIAIFLTLFAMMTITSCTDREVTFCDTELSCDTAECIFTIDNSEGKTMFLSCFGKWGIYAAQSGIDGSDVWLIVDDWDVQYEEEGIDVVFCGYVRDNTLPLLLPDPSIGAVYQIRIENVDFN